MNRLQRYLFSQVAAAVSLSMGLFVFVLVIGNVLKQVIGELASGRLDWLTFFKLIGLLIPGVVPYALPIGVLTGVLMVLGRMSAQNEIVSMKAAGMSLWRIVSPIFLVALIGVVVSFFINFEYAPLANDTYKKMLRGAVRENPSSLIAPGEFTRFKKGYVIYPQSREDNRLQDVWLWELNEEGQVLKASYAQSAVFTFIENAQEGGGDILKIEANQMIAETRNNDAPEDFSKAIKINRIGHFSFEIPQILEGIGEGEKKLKHNTFLELMALRTEGWKIKAEPTEREREFGYRAISETTPEEQFADRIAVQLQIQSNMANAFGVLAMTMLAIPLGIKTSRSETLVNVALALALALTFYVLTVSISAIKDPAFRPDILVWVPNFLFQALGIWLLRKAARN